MAKLLELGYSAKDAEQIIEQVAPKLVETLKQEGLYQRNLLYRGFSSNRIKKTLKTGIDRDSNSSTWFHVTDIDPKNILFAIPEYPSLQSTIPSGVFYAIRCGLKTAKEGLIAKMARKCGEFAISVYERNLEELKTTWDPCTHIRPDHVKPIVVFKIKRAGEEGR